MLYPCLVLLPLLVLSVRCALLTNLGRFHAAHAGFIQVEEDTHAVNVLDRYNLFIAAFNPFPFTTDHVYEVAAIGRKLANINRTHILDVSHRITWPNEISQVPDAVFHKELVAAAGGFLVPLKTHGTIGLFDLSVSPPRGPYTITNNADSAWFYHRVDWKDMNGDGRIDAVSCRAKKPLIGGAQGELVWFEHPASGALQHPWTMHVIDHGPDVYFDFLTLHTPQGTFDCIVTAGFFSKSLNIYWTTDQSGKWDDTSKIKSRVIDHSFGAVFDVQAVDLNGDGGLDLLVTGNDAHTAYVYSYEIPADFRTGKFQRHTLAGGFSPRLKGIGHGAPGSAQTVFPTSHTNGKPVIVLSGDDDGRAYVLKPSSTSHGDWTYDKETFLDVGQGTVGEIAIKDVDGDGYGEVFVPAYTQGYVYVYTFRK
ncbi:uncharacterized protein [Haliotis cracherodii]|uniref:uncharacterized protein n=1 Tax=Haliotis cracherodii TaxID=6455 RepID=UPI0039EBB133